MKIWGCEEEQEETEETEKGRKEGKGRKFEIMIRIMIRIRRKKLEAALKPWGAQAC
jgi:hypothetical protein